MGLGAQQQSRNANANANQRSRNQTPVQVQRQEPEQVTNSNLIHYIPKLLPHERVFPIQIGCEVFKLSGASISSDGELPSVLPNPESSTHLKATSWMFLTFSPSQLSGLF